MAFYEIISSIKKTYEKNNSVYKEITLMNLKRIYYMAIVAMPVHIIHVVLFSLSSYSTREEGVWRTGIIISHIILSTLMASIAVILGKSKKDNYLKANILQYMVIFVLILFGIAIVTLDQLVTQSITPFILVCVVIGIAVVIRPLVAVPVYLTTYLIYFFSVSITQNNPGVLLSNRVNGLTGIGIGIFLSIIVWNSHANNIIQKRHIEKQQNLLKDKNIKLEKMASYDSLTGLMNRRKFDRIIDIREKENCKSVSTLILTDIDDFKEINDKYGHPAGDRVLKDFSRILQEELKQNHIISRWGGDEIIILLPGVCEKQGKKTAETLRKKVESHIFEINGKNLSVTASFGISSINGVNKESFKKGYLNADRALYNAKESGKNNSALLTEDTDIK